jgi:FKBP-type peptidyl-prolyl cis-trans isomerase FklB
MKKIFVFAAILALLISARAFAAADAAPAAPAAVADKAPDNGAAPVAADKEGDKEKLSAFVGYQVGNSVKQDNGLTEADLAEVIKGIKAGMAGEKSPYSIGFSIGANLKRDLEPGDISLDGMLRGMKLAVMSQPAPLTDEQAQELMVGLKAELQARKKNEGERNKKAGEAFLAENKTKEGVKVTDSGLQYIVEKEGDGAMPTGTDTVSVNYRGTLISGKEFDSSYSRGKPASFPVAGVIPGWTEALKLMKVGAKYKLFIPAGLAYGEQGSGSNVPPNSMLIFDVELLGIEAAKAMPMPNGQEGIQMKVTPPPGR